MKQEILVKVEHMNKRFGSTVALKDVSIEVCSGRVLDLLERMVLVNQQLHLLLQECRTQTAVR